MCVTGELLVLQVFFEPADVYINTFQFSPITEAFLLSTFVCTARSWALLDVTHKLLHEVLSVSSPCMRILLHHKELYSCITAVNYPRQIV